MILDPGGPNQLTSLYSTGTQLLEGVLRGGVADPSTWASRRVQRIKVRFGKLTIIGTYMYLSIVE